MAPPDTKTYREIEVCTSNVDYDPDKHRMRMRTELGYNIIFDVEPHVSVNAYAPFVNGVPEFQTNVLLRPLNIEKGEKPMSQQQVQELIKGRSVIKEDFDYENFTVGFVYANQQNPNNHKWMFEFRKRQQIFWAQHFLGVSLDKVPITTMSWFDGVYHGRFLVQKKDVKIVTEEKPGYVTIRGHGTTNPVNETDFTSIIPADIEKIRLRYNIREDYWYADLLKKGQVISDLKPIKVRHITAENMKFDGVADFNFPKPKVYYICNRKDIADIRVMAETLFVVGKND